jgi:Tol biopolymer transport system component
MLGADTAVDLSAPPCQLGSGPDVRRPAVSWDGKTIAFAARATATDPLAIYTINADGTGCAKQADIGNHGAMSNNLPVHDFDPAFSPPVNGVESIVFASTRGNLDAGGSTFDYSGTQRTPADPTKPNANLYVLEQDPGAAGKMRVRQLTWQLNMERLPSFMQDGRLIFTTEKRAPGFYQLALRRQNLDGGDYHPLYAQRGTIGYEQATYVVELADKNFATVFSNPTAVHGAGVIGVFNRSIGVDFQSKTASDYVVDPSVLKNNAPESDFFKHSLTMLAADGSYTSPSPLPDGKMLVSFGTGAPASFGGDYDLYVLDPSTGAKTKLLGNAGTAEVEAVAVYPRTDKGVFASAPDEPNGHTMVDAVDPTKGATAEVTVLDMSLLASLLFQNTPTGRVVEPDLSSFDIYEDLPPDVTSLGACGGFIACDAYGKVFVKRRLLGSVPVLPDGSAHFLIPGGLPIVLRLAEDSESQRLNLPRWQREEMTFLPGETAHQAFETGFFDNLCAGCHGAVSGRPLDAALKPDFLTQASAVAAVGQPPSDFSGPPSKRGTPVGPPVPP